MHGLDVIIIRNAAAAGREAAEHDKAGNIAEGSQIFEADNEWRRSDVERRLPLSLSHLANETFDESYFLESQR
jgi:hypothetical protein